MDFAEGIFVSKFLAALQGKLLVFLWLENHWVCWSGFCSGSKPSGLEDQKVVLTTRFGFWICMIEKVVFLKLASLDRSQGFS